MFSCKRRLKVVNWTGGVVSNVEGVEDVVERCVVEVEEVEFFECVFDVLVRGVSVEICSV